MNGAGIFRIWFVLSVALAIGALAPSGYAQDIEGRINRAIQQAGIGPSRVGVSVVDLNGGPPLVAINDADGFIPASNMKLLTAGAALEVLGPDFAFETRFILDDKRLIVIGDGDPAFGDPDQLAKLSPPLGVEEMLDRIAHAILAAGISELDEVVVDPRIFDSELIHPGWPRDQLDRHYCAPVSGMLFHAGTLWFYITPGARQDAPADLRLSPTAPWLRTMVENRVRTIRGGSVRVGVLRDPTTDRFRVIGDLGAPAAPVRVALHEPDRFFALLLADRLASAGVRVRRDADGPAVRVLTPDDPVSTGVVLAKVRTPITDAVDRCNIDSANFYAEALLKRSAYAVTGRPGSWADGAGVLRMVVAERLGPDAAASIRVSDGSGLSRDNIVTPRLMTGWLLSLASDERIGRPFIQSLPTPGEGTLRSRFSSKSPVSVVRAKSGTINGVRALSGIIDHEPSGRRLAFSILVNDIPLTPGVAVRARDLHETIVLIVDDWLSEMAPGPRQGARPAGAATR